MDFGNALASGIASGMTNFLNADTAMKQKKVADEEQFNNAMNMHVAQARFDNEMAMKNAAIARQNAIDMNPGAAIFNTKTGQIVPVPGSVPGALVPAGTPRKIIANMTPDAVKPVASKQKTLRPQDARIMTAISNTLPTIDEAMANMTKKDKKTGQSGLNNKFPSSSAASFLEKWPIIGRFSGAVSKMEPELLQQHKLAMDTLASTLPSLSGGRTMTPEERKIFLKATDVNENQIQDIYKFLKDYRTKLSSMSQAMQNTSSSSIDPKKALDDFNPYQGSYQVGSGGVGADAGDYGDGGYE